VTKFGKINRLCRSSACHHHLTSEVRHECKDKLSVSKIYIQYTEERCISS